MLGEDQRGPEKNCSSYRIIRISHPGDHPLLFDCSTPDEKPDQRISESWENKYKHAAHNYIFQHKHGRVRNARPLWIRGPVEEKFLVEYQVQVALLFVAIDEKRAGAEGVPHDGDSHKNQLRTGRSFLDRRHCIVAVAKAKHPIAVWIRTAFLSRP